MTVGGSGSGRYRVLERSVQVHAPLGRAQLGEISTLLGRQLGHIAHPPGFVIDLTDISEPDGLLAYLRRQDVPHTVAEERRWDPPP
jgi:hypothetical protein